MNDKRRIGIVGYGHLGKFLVDKIKQHPGLELAFVWNRTQEVFHQNLDACHILENLDDFCNRSLDLIVEVAHPSITSMFGAAFLRHCDFMIGSPSALADVELEKELKEAATDHGLYVPSGAFWGGEDIKKMADQDTIKGLRVTMVKHPSSFKVDGHLRKLCNQVKTQAVNLYDGPVRNLCPLAPNNVNTMAAAAIAAHNLGFDRVQGRLIADPNSLKWHTIEIAVTGPGTDGQSFTVDTTRRNPANPGAVTGMATYHSFFSSLLCAHGKGPGVHLC